MVTRLRLLESGRDAQLNSHGFITLQWGKATQPVLTHGIGAEATCCCQALDGQGDSSTCAPAPGQQDAEDGRSTALTGLAGFQSCAITNSHQGLG